MTGRSAGRAICSDSQLLPGGQGGIIFPVSLRACRHQLPGPFLQFSARTDGTSAANLDTTGFRGSYSYDDGCTSYRSGFVDLGAGYYAQVDSYGGPCYGAGFSYVYLSKYAADYVYFSSYHDLVYGTVSEYTSGYQVGTFLNANFRLDTRFIVGTDTGAFGRNVGTDLFDSPYDYSWDYLVDYGTYLVHYEGHQRGRQLSGYFFGQTTPRQTTRLGHPARCAGCPVERSVPPATSLRHLI